MITTSMLFFSEFLLNPEGKTAVCILHEYAQNVLRSQPTYEFKEIGRLFVFLICLKIFKLDWSSVLEYTVRAE